MADGTLQSEIPQRKVFLIVDVNLKLQVTKSETRFIVVLPFTRITYMYRLQIYLLLLAVRLYLFNSKCICVLDLKASVS